MRLITSLHVALRPPKFYLVKLYHQYSAIRLVMNMILSAKNKLLAIVALRFFISKNSRQYNFEIRPALALVVNGKIIEIIKFVWFDGEEI